MREQRDEQEPRELFNAEVSIYTDDCGTTRKDCVTDCIGGGALITPMN